MKKSDPRVLIQELKPTESNYKLKLNLLTELVEFKTGGHIVPNELVKWCTNVGIPIKDNHEDHCDWWSTNY